MAISRAQMLKELLPGLNALFGLEYDKYEDDGDYDDHDEREFDSYAGIGVDH